MIIAIVGIVHQYDLLPYYLQHYRALGVERFVVACNPSKIDSSGALTRLLAKQPDLEVVDLPRSFQRSSLVGVIEEETRRHVATDNDWVIPADLDELNQYPHELKTLIKLMEEEGCTHVVGEFSDRLASEGKLAELRPYEDNIAIWDQYPYDSDVTKLLVKGYTSKVLLSRGDLSWRLGHHSMADNPDLKPYGKAGVAHHFKWRSNLANIADWRIENEERARVPWIEESIRLKKYLQQNGRIIPEEMNARPGWKPGEHSSSKP